MGPRLGPVGWLRWGWRQLTSMRTALFLLLPARAGRDSGQCPARSVPPTRSRSTAGSPRIPGPVRPSTSWACSTSSDRPWFAAIYILLFLSLIGCVLPRTAAHGAPCAPRPRRRPAASIGSRRHGAGSPTTRDVLASAAARAARAAVAGHARRRGVAGRREGVHPGDRQPAVPRRPAPGPGRRGRWVRCSAGRARSSCGRATASPTPSPSTTPSRPAGWPTPTACPPFCFTLSRLRRDVRAHGLPARRAPVVRGDAAVPLRTRAAGRAAGGVGQLPAAGGRREGLSWSATATPRTCG